MVKVLEYYMKDAFKNALYESCKDVFFPTTSLPALSAMCGIYGQYCNPERWFEFMVDVNSFSPFQINYVFSNQSEVNGMTPHSNIVTQCDKPVPVSINY